MPIVFTICHSPEGVPPQRSQRWWRPTRSVHPPCPHSHFIDARANALLASVGAGSSDVEEILTLERGGHPHPGVCRGTARGIAVTARPMNQGEAQRVFASRNVWRTGAEGDEGAIAACSYSCEGRAITREAARECDLHNPR